MPEMTAFAGKAAGVVSFIAFVPYLIAIFRGTTKPNPASWWIWTIVSVLLMASYWSSGAEHTKWVPISYMVGPLITAIISLKYGIGGWTKFDRLCLIGAVGSLIPWLLSQSSLPTLFINLFIDFLGLLPTLRKVLQDTEGEDRFAWSLFTAGNVLNLAAIDRFEAGIIAYPLYMFLASGSIFFLLMFRQRKTPSHTS